MQQGKALYIGISNYSAEQTKAITKVFRALGTPFIIHQPRYNMLDRWIEDGLTDVLADKGTGAITFSPLAQGLLTNRYLNGIPADLRAARPDSPFLSPEKVDQTISTVQELNKIAQQRGQSLAEMALAWNLQQPTVASVLVGASRLSQLQDSVHALDNLTFTAEELAAIQKILA